MAGYNIQPATIPNGITGVPYSTTFSLAGGATTAPLTFTKTSGTFPDGLILNASTGVLSGTPLTAGSYAFRINGVDSASHNAFRDYTMTVAVPVCTPYVDCTKQSLSTEDLIRLLIKVDSNGCAALNTVRN